MTNLAYSDIFITLVVIGVVLFAAHRLGQANPIGTGKLARRLGAVELKVAELDGRLDNVDQALGTLAKSAADTARGVEAIRIELAADRGLTERTWSAMDRLQNYFIEDAFERRREK